MNLIIDIGNTRIKTACFQDDNLIWQKSYSSVSEINKTSLKDFKNVIIYDINGELRLRQNMIQGNARLNTEELHNGIYLCIIQEAKGSCISQQKLTIIK